MNFQSLRTKFLELLHPSAAGRVDLRLENTLLGTDDNQVVLVIDKEIYSIGSLAQATQCLEHVLQSSAPEYWKESLKDLNAHRHELETLKTWESNPEVMVARMASALGWVDRRIGNRTIDKEDRTSDELGSEVERRLKAIRQGFPAPEVVHLAAARM